MQLLCWWSFQHARYICVLLCVCVCMCVCVCVCVNGCMNYPRHNALADVSSKHTNLVKEDTLTGALSVSNWCALKPTFQPLIQLVILKYGPLNHCPIFIFCTCLLWHILHVHKQTHTDSVCECSCPRILQLTVWLTLTNYISPYNRWVHTNI